MKKTFVERSIIKQLLFALGTLLFTVGLLYLTLTDLQGGGVWRGVPVEYFWSLNIFGTIFFGVCLVSCIFRLVSTQNVLVISEKGFVNNSTMFISKFVSWADVERVYIATIQRNKYLVVSTNSGKEINISLDTAKMSYEKVQSIMQKYLNFYRLTRSSNM